MYLVMNIEYWRYWLVTMAEQKQAWYLIGIGNSAARSSKGVGYDGLIHGTTACLSRSRSCQLMSGQVAWDTSNYSDR